MLGTLCLPKAPSQSKHRQAEKRRQLKAVPCSVEMYRQYETALCGLGLSTATACKVIRYR